MRLLVSLRSADEVDAALAGGADIIDAKEPALGSLGPVSPRVWWGIADRVPPSVPLSAALGDMTSAEAVRQVITTFDLPPRLAPAYVKFGFAGVRSRAVAAAVLSAAVETAGRTSLRPTVVPVAYGDWSHAESLQPQAVLDVALAAGARALLIDTFLKDGSGLLDHVGIDTIRSLSQLARASGVLLALGGSLDRDRVATLIGLADVIGIRGAACRGGREGVVDARLVHALRSRLLHPERSEGGIPGGMAPSLRSG